MQSIGGVSSFVTAAVCLSLLGLCGEFESVLRDDVNGCSYDLWCFQSRHSTRNEFVRCVWNNGSVFLFMVIGISMSTTHINCIHGISGKIEVQSSRDE